MFRNFALILLLTALLAGMAVPALAQEGPAPESGWIVITTANLRVRAQPTLNSPALQTAPFGTSLPVYGRSADNAWLQVAFRGVIGWVSRFYVDALFSIGELPVVDGTDPNVARLQERVSAPDGTLVLSGQLVVFNLSTDVNIRAEPLSGGTRIGLLPAGERAIVTLISRNRQWGLIDYNGITGWVALGVLRQLGDIRTVPRQGVPNSGAPVPLPPSATFSLEQRAAVGRAQGHLAQYLPDLSSLVSILSSGANGGIITCGPVMGFFRNYAIPGRDLQLVPQLEPIVADMNAALTDAARARAQWVLACGEDDTLVTRDGFRQWLPTAQAAVARLLGVQTRLANLASR